MINHSEQKNVGLLDSIPVPQGGYKCIVVDPPWKYGKWSGGSGIGRGTLKARSFESYSINKPLPYATLTIQEIKEMDVKRLAATDCDIYLWTTQKYLPISFEVMREWGFDYKQILTWCKTPRGTGQGGLFCPTTEFLLLGRCGNMPKNKVRIDSTWWNIKRPHNQHSKKPEFFQTMIEEMSDEPRIELFARRPRSGWFVWGNEVEESDNNLSRINRFEFDLYKSK